MIGGVCNGNGRDQHQEMNTDPYESLPVDSDLEVDDTATQPPKPLRPLHLRWRYVGLVFLGGAAGTTARHFLSLAIPDWHSFPVATFGINITGAFLLGLVLESLVRSGPDEGHRRTLRLLIGTGFMGGYTTYSSFAVGTDGLIAAGHIPESALYGLGSIVVGAAASIAGIVLGAALHRTRSRRSHVR